MVTTRIYPSAVDKWFYPSLFVAPFVFCTLLTFLTRQSWVGALIGSGVGVIALLAIWPFTRPCHYTLSNDLLKIKAGFLEIDIPLATIQKVEQVRGFLAAPCLSINRVLITMKDGKEMVSPMDRDEFIADLSSRIGKATEANKSVP